MERIMLKLIVGVKGTGKTKTLIGLVNTAANAAPGCVVCLEKGTKLIHEIKYTARLIDTDEYLIKNAEMLYGMIAGCYASNHDVMQIFLDSALKICNNDMPGFIEFVKRAEEFGAKHNIDITMTSSIPVEEVPEELKKYL